MRAFFLLSLISLSIISLSLISSISPAHADLSAYFTPLPSPAAFMSIGKPHPPDPQSLPDCGKEVNLAAPGGLLSDIPVSEQGDLGICYAETGALLFDAWRYRHQDPARIFRTSPVAAAISATLDIPFAKDMEGGDACWVFDHLAKEGACDRREVMKALTHQDESLEKSIKVIQSSWEEFQTWRKARSLWEKVDAQFRTESRSALAEYKKRRELALRTHSCLKDGGVAPPLLPSILKIEAALERDNPLQFLEDLYESACPKSSRIRAPEAPICWVIRTDPSPSYEARIRKTLESKDPLPVPIGFCSQVLRQGRNTPSGSYLIHWLGSANCGNHNALIIGQRRNERTGRCQYLVRNSWGSDCSSYHADWDCQNGMIWIDQDTLLSNTYEYTFLE